MKVERGSTEVVRVIPPDGKEKLDGLYLNPPFLYEIAEKLKRPVVIVNYVTDLNGVIATKTPKGYFIPSPEITNSDDWDRLQELLAQAHGLITSGKYLSGFAKGRTTQDILTQFEPGAEYYVHGNWREKHGLNRRPTIIVPSRSLDFPIPQILIDEGREILIYTTKAMHGTQNAKDLSKISSNVHIIEAGDTTDVGVDGGKMITDLKIRFEEKGAYPVIKMATGPSVLDILLKANVVDRIYITEVQRIIPVDNPSDSKTILSDGKKVAELSGFSLVSKFVQEKVKIDDGTTTSQHFLIFESDRFKAERESKNIPI